jgi:hypothetical protein
MRASSCAVDPILPQVYCVAVGNERKLNRLTQLEAVSLGLQNATTNICWVPGGRVINCD